MAVVLLASFPVAPLHLSAQKAVAANAPQTWTAHWITAAGAPARDLAVLHFRKVISLERPPSHFIVHVSADSRFIFYVNGQRIGDGPARSDPAHWRYETYDIAPSLKPGANVVAATVWNFGVHAPMAQMSDRTGFLVQGHSDAERVADTDPSWQAEMEPGHSLAPGAQDEVRRFYYVGGPGERIDGLSYDWSWQDPASKAGRWSAAVYPVFGMDDAERSRAAPQNEQDHPNAWWLQPDPLPAMTYESIDPGRIVLSSLDRSSQFPAQPFDVPANSTMRLLLERSSLTTAYPELNVSGGASARIRLKYAEALIDDHGEKGNRNEVEGKHLAGMYDEFIADGGQRSFSPLWWRTWRFVEIEVKTGDAPLRLESLRARFTAYPFELKARFASSNPELENLWEIAWRTARLTAHDTYMDCPYWEQLQYIADTRPQLLLSYALSGDDRLARQALQAFDYSRLPEGITQSRYPTNEQQTISAFTPLWVSSIHDFWMYRGDEDFVRKLLPDTRPALDWYLRKQSSSGMLGLVPYWNFVDWTTGPMSWHNGAPPQQADGQSAVLTLLYAAALRDAAEMEEALGYPALASRYREAARRAVEATRKLCWDEARGLIADTPAKDNFSEHANILAVITGAIPSSDAPAVMHRLIDRELVGHDPYTTQQIATGSFYFRFYLARALKQSEMGDEYLSLLGPWKKMMGLGLTTFAETPDPTRSEDHGWSSHPDFDLLTIVAGIEPAAPGFQTVRIEPHLGKGRDALTRLDATMAHPRGSITAKYTITAVGGEAVIALPPGVNGVFRWHGRDTPLYSGSQTFKLEP